LYHRACESLAMASIYEKYELEEEKYTLIITEFLKIDIAF